MRLFGVIFYGFKCDWDENRLRLNKVCFNGVLSYVNMLFNVFSL